MNVQTAFASAYMFLDSKPGSISSDTTPTFTFDGMDMSSEGPYTGDIECKIDDGSFSICTSPYTTPALSAGDHTFTVHAVGDATANATVSYSWNINQTPTFSGSSSVSGGVNGAPITITDLQINDLDNDILGVKLSVPSGVLKLASTTGLNFTGSKIGSTIIFSGTRTNINTALATLTYTPAIAGTVTISATLTGANGGNRETLNGHFYRIINSAVDWNTAKNAAAASTYGGVSGYLVTVTSAAEKDYLQNRMSDGVWMGASDSALEGDWRWMDGPESGAAFWSGGSGGMAVGGSYTNWQSGMPDNYNGNENCGEMRLNGSESWNDENCGSIRQYIIEYGTDSNLPALDTKQISVSSAAASADIDGDGLADAVETNAPNDGDANNDGIPDDIQANVSSLYSPISKNYVTTQTDCDANQQVQSTIESVSQKDPAYDYPYGLIGFKGTSCGTPGAMVTVTQFYFGTITPSTPMLRKWNSLIGTYATIDGAMISAITIGGKPAVKVVYQVTDGSSLDQDGVVDGNITDPVGLAVPAVAVPNTGLGGRALISRPLMFKNLYS